MVKLILPVPDEGPIATGHPREAERPSLIELPVNWGDCNTCNDIAESVIVIRTGTDFGNRPAEPDFMLPAADDDHFATHDFRDAERLIPGRAPSLPPSVSLSPFQGELPDSFVAASRGHGVSSQSYENHAVPIW